MIGFFYFACTRAEPPTDVDAEGNGPAPTSHSGVLALHSASVDDPLPVAAVSCEWRTGTTDVDYRVGLHPTFDSFSADGELALECVDCGLPLEVQPLVREEADRALTVALTVDESAAVPYVPGTTTHFAECLPMSPTEGIHSVRIEADGTEWCVSIGQKRLTPWDCATWPHRPEGVP
ncbi:MAG: hypothetical protein KC621_31490 [Myxococcales bacterium]|nr:hypothetical protein [Myxococcales bacterium]